MDAPPVVLRIRGISTTGLLAFLLKVVNALACLGSERLTKKYGITTAANLGYDKIYIYIIHAPDVTE